MQNLNFSQPKKLILIAASTGGPGLIEKILKSFPRPINATVILLQHMDRFNLESFSRRLSRVNSLNIQLIEKNSDLLHGEIYLLADTATLQKHQGEIYFQKETLHKGFYHPTIDELFFSAAQLKDIEIAAYLLSGIGSDGAKGLLALKNADSKTVAQDEKSSIVYGMPKAAFEIGACQYVMSIDEIIDDIQKELY
jgi:chemotaxis response regulator CheB